MYIFLKNYSTATWELTRHKQQFMLLGNTFSIEVCSISTPEDHFLLKRIQRTQFGQLRHKLICWTMIKLQTSTKGSLRLLKRIIERFWTGWMTKFVEVHHTKILKKQSKLFESLERIVNIMSSGLYKRVSFGSAKISVLIQKSGNGEMST